MEWVALAAHQSDSMLACAVDQARDRPYERVLSGHRLIQRMAVRVIVILAGGSAAEVIAEEEVAHALIAHRRFELVAIEVRRETRVRI